LWVEGAAAVVGLGAFDVARFSELVWERFLCTIGDVSEVTRIFDSIAQGDPKAAEELLPLVYEELRKLAAHKMANEAPGQTLQATALVHEAWLRLVGKEDAQFENRAHFFAAAAEAMRRILIANARRKQRQKHGGGWERVDLEHVQVAEPLPSDELLALDEALTELAQRDPQAAELVQLRFFAGLGQEEAAEVLGLSQRTAYRTWAYARAWLFRQVVGGKGPAA
jgi:RNA polymerase sigma factor (TIGR02999 family)